MKTLLQLTFLCLTCILFINCNKDDDSKEPEVIECDQWFEGDPCVAMTAKFVGDYEGGAGFCGTNYEYEVTATANVVNGITIGIANPDGPIIYTFNALLTSSTEFNIPTQEVSASGETGTVSGFGSGDGTMLSYHLIVEGAGECDHEATKIN